MTILKRAVFLLLLAVLTAGLLGCSTEPTKTVGMVIKLRPDRVEQYKALHADSNPGVRDLLTKYHMHNFSIFLQKIGEEYYEFGYYEYTGNNFKEDMAKLDAEPRNKKWLEVTDPLQIPLEGAAGWTTMERVYNNP